MELPANEMIKQEKSMPGAKVKQVAAENSFFSRRMYVNNAAVPPPSE